MKDRKRTTNSLLDHLQVIPDPHMEKKCKYKLIDIIAVTVFVRRSIVQEA